MVAACWTALRCCWMLFTSDTLFHFCFTFFPLFPAAVEVSVLPAGLLAGLERLAADTLPCSCVGEHLAAVCDITKGAGLTRRVCETAVHDTSPFKYVLLVLTCEWRLVVLRSVELFILHVAFK